MICWQFFIVEALSNTNLSIFRYVSLAIATFYCCFFPWYAYTIYTTASVLFIRCSFDICLAMFFYVNRGVLHTLAHTQQIIYSTFSSIFVAPAVVFLLALPRRRIFILWFWIAQRNLSFLSCFCLVGFEWVWVRTITIERIVEWNVAPVYTCNLQGISHKIHSLHAHTNT